MPPSREHLPQDTSLWMTPSQGHVLHGDDILLGISSSREHLLPKDICFLGTSSWERLILGDHIFPGTSPSRVSALGDTSLLEGDAFHSAFSLSPPSSDASPPCTHLAPHPTTALDQRELAPLPACPPSSHHLPVTRAGAIPPTCPPAPWIPSGLPASLM